MGTIKKLGKFIGNIAKKLVAGVSVGRQTAKDNFGSKVE